MMKGQPYMDRDEPQIIILVEAAGGVMRHIIDLYKGLKKHYPHVTVILSPVRIDERYKGELGALDQNDIVYLPMQRSPHPRDVLAYWTILGIIKKNKGRKIILHAHSTKAGLLGCVLHRSVAATIFTPHAYRGLDPKLAGLARFAVEQVEAFYSSSFDRVIAEVPLEFNYAAKLGISKSALQLIPNGIPIHTVNFDEIYARRTNLAVTPTLGFVGRLVYQKNPLLFIEVLNEVIKGGCEAKAILLGEGPLRAEMKKLAEGYGIAERIEWRGEAPAGLSYPEMDVMVHTSLYEALPYSLLEASAALLPIVATSNPGSRAILGQLLPDNLVAEPNAKLIAAKVLLILQNDSLRLEQMRLLEEIAQQYSTETMLLRYKQLYDSLLANIA
jgi:glycosyltransferase involved in cell wall biosynthesis